ncbi:hypothetical protein BDZ89DRAFT_1053958 [Hymenopellis radicata]|nr:hypothetical protein BDZ89DRAFT_1053958 [Hymenopellis radicata]
MGKTQNCKQLEQRDPGEPALPTELDPKLTTFPKIHDFMDALVTQYTATCGLESVAADTFLSCPAQLNATELRIADDDPKETVSQPPPGYLDLTLEELYEKIDQETVALRQQLSESAADWMSFKGGIFLGTADAAATQARYEHTRNLAFEAFPMSVEEPLDAARTYGHLWSEDLGGHRHYVKDWLAELDDALGPLLRETEVAFGV